MKQPSPNIVKFFEDFEDIVYYLKTLYVHCLFFKDIVYSLRTFSYLCYYNQFSKVSFPDRIDFTYVANNNQ